MTGKNCPFQLWTVFLIPIVKIFIREFFQPTREGTLTAEHSIQSRVLQRNNNCHGNSLFRGYINV